MASPELEAGTCADVASWTVSLTDSPRPVGRDRVLRPAVIVRG